MNKKTNLFLDLFFLILTSSICIFYQLGAKTLTTWDELCYAQWSKEMFFNGNWLTTFQFGQPLFEKPPLYIFLTSIAYHLFGITEFSTRLFSALSGIGIITVTYLFAKQLYGRTEGFIAALLLLSSVHFFNYTRLTTLDITLTLFVSLSIYFFYIGLSKSVFYLLSGFSIALALLTKGLGGFLPMIIIFSYVIFSKKMSVLKNYFFISGMLLAGMIFGAWIIHEYSIYGYAFIDNGFFKNFSRVYNVVEQHTGSIFTYLKVIVYKGKLFGGPALFISLVFLILHFVDKKRDEKHLLPLTWIFVTLILFSISKTKLHWYIMPIYPPLFIILAMAICKLPVRPQLWGDTAFSVVGLLRRTTQYASVALLPAALSAPITEALQLPLSKKVAYGLSLLSFIFLIYYQYSNHNKYNDNSNLIFKKLGLKIREIKKEGDTLIVFQGEQFIENRAIIFYSDMQVSNLHQLPQKGIKNTIILTNFENFLKIEQPLLSYQPKTYKIDGFVITRIE